MEHDRVTYLCEQACNRSGVAGMPPDLSPDSSRYEEYGIELASILREPTTELEDGT